MLQFVLFSKAGTFKTTLTPAAAHVELLWNAVSFAELEFDDDDAKLSLIAAGDRVRVTFDGIVRMFGPIVGRSGSSEDETLTVLVEDDWRWFALLGWPKPAAAITAQTDEYRRYSGPVETIVKSAASELSSRLGLGWTVPASTGLGASRRVEFRFHPLADKLVPLLEEQKLTLRLTSGVVSVHQGALFPRVLTPATRILRKFEWSETAPEATRVVVGGEGEGAARVLREYVDTALEAALGYKREVFLDARNAQGITDFTEDAEVALAEGAGKVSVAAELVESSWFRFGLYDVGDRVTVNVGPVSAVEVIRSVVIDEDRRGDRTVVPTIGEFEDDADSKMGRQVSALARGVRDVRRF